MHGPPELAGPSSCQQPEIEGGEGETAKDQRDLNRVIPATLGTRCDKSRRAGTPLLRRHGQTRSLVDERLMYQVVKECRVMRCLEERHLQH
jgi:hypothetical protein